MAEVVQKRLEEMMDELEQMERVGLFETPEIQKIISKRRAFEYKLRRKVKSKSDYMNYIQYEINLLALLRKRRQRIGYKFKQREIEVAIVQRIHRLFRDVCFRFQADEQLWISHIEFSKSRKELSTVSKLYAQTLQLHNRKPVLWIAAAKWEMQSVKSMSKARRILQRGLRFNTNNDRLLTEYFRLELLFVEKLLNRRKVMKKEQKSSEDIKLETEDVDDNPFQMDSVLQCEAVWIVFEETFKNQANNFDLFLQFLDISRYFKFAENLQTRILKHLKPHFPDKTLEFLLWESKSFLFQADQPQASGKRLPRDEIWALEEKCFSHIMSAIGFESLSVQQVYDASFKLALDREILEKPNKLKVHRISRIITLFQEAVEKKGVSEQMYSMWFLWLERNGQAVFKDPAKLVQAFEDGFNQANTLYPKSALLKPTQLRFLMSNDSSSSAIWDLASNEPFVDFKTDTGSQFLNWFIKTMPERIEELFNLLNLTKETKALQSVQLMYIDWLQEEQGVESAFDWASRNVIKKSTQVSIDFYFKLIDIELTREPLLSLKRVRDIFESAILNEHFAENEIKIWTRYIQLETMHSLGNPAKVSRIQWKAEKSLKPDLLETFQKCLITKE